MQITIFLQERFFKICFLDSTIFISKSNGLERVKAYFLSISRGFYIDVRA